MATGKKKRKAASNPQRGFATSSVPSKKTQRPAAPKSASAEELGHPEDDVIRPQTVNGSGCPPLCGSRRKPNGHGQSPGTEPEVDIETLELEALLEKHGPKCKAEAIRAANQLKVENRTLRLKSFPVDHDKWFTDHSIHSTLTQGYPRPNLPFLPFGTALSIPEDEILVKTWVLRQVLTQIQVARVDEALTVALNPASSDYIWGQEQALEWLAANNAFKIVPIIEANASLAAAATASDETVPGTHTIS